MSVWAVVLAVLIACSDSCAAAKSILFDGIGATRPIIDSSSSSSSSSVNHGSARRTHSVSKEHTPLPRHGAKRKKLQFISPMTALLPKRRKQRIEAIVFYGRRSFVQSLECYLRNNLASNGGLLQKVHFYVKTNNTEDLQYLEALLESQPAYYDKVLLQEDSWDWSKHYSKLQGDTWYFKIDDDIVFIEHGALEHMLHLAEHSDCLVVSANVINHTRLTFLHIASGATTLFKRKHPASNQWVPNRKEHINSLPQVQEMKYAVVDNCSWTGWECPTMAHYSFLHNYHTNQLQRYRFHMHDFNAMGYERWSINMILFRGSEFNQGNVERDDEHSISITIPKERKRRSCAAGQALAAHYGYYTQRDNLLNNTDLVEQYRLLANSVCHGQLVPLP